ncbi:hypothetical protein QBC39DRAFT_348552, partial [Podospora conica]
MNPPEDGPDYPPDEAEPQHSTPPSKSACKSSTLRRHRSKAQIQGKDSKATHHYRSPHTPLSQSPTALQATVFPALHLFNLRSCTCASLGTWSRFGMWSRWQVAPRKRQCQQQRYERNNCNYTSKIQQSCSLRFKHTSEAAAATATAIPERQQRQFSGRGSAGRKFLRGRGSTGAAIQQRQGKTTSTISRAKNGGGGGRGSYLGLTLSIPTIICD